MKGSANKVANEKGLFIVGTDIISWRNVLPKFCGKIYLAHKSFSSNVVEVTIFESVAHPSVHMDP